MINTKRLTQLFAQLVSIDSPSKGERQMCDYLKERLTGLGFTLREDQAGEAIGGNCGNLYGYLPGELGGDPLLFCSHMDTVEPAKGKEAVFHDDGTITSKGDTVLGSDDVSGLAAILESVTALQENKVPHRPIEILFTVAEELGMTGVAQVNMPWLNAKEGYVLDLDGPVGRAAHRAPTILLFTATVKGKASHAALAPQEGIHAIQAASLAVSRMELGLLPGGETEVNVGTIKGGLYSNIIPDTCVVAGEIRSYSDQAARKQEALFRQIFDQAAAEYGAQVDFQVKQVTKAYHIPLDHPVVERFQRSCGQLGLETELIQTFGGSDNNRLSTEGMSALVLSCAMNKCHSLEEYTTVEELTNITNLVYLLMQSQG